MKPTAAILPAGVLISALLLTGCPNRDDNDQPDPVTQTYGFTVTTTNLTAAQPVSPLAVVLHQPSLQLFAVGAEASEALEQLAEGGDNGPLLSEIRAGDAAFNAVSGAGVLMPGDSETLALSAELTAEQAQALSLSLVTMLVNTNDAMSAVSGLDVTNLAVGDSISVSTLVYDAGTEANSESADTVPGPAANGGAQEGFNAERDDANQVLMHSGVISADDGLVNSTLTALHRFDNPAMQVTVTRTQ